MAEAAVMEWQHYLKTRDFKEARRLLKLRFEEKDLPQPFVCLEGPNHTKWEKARHDAELVFFGETRGGEKIEELMGRIIDERYRETENSETIDLTGVPARRFIAAERLLQRRLLMLSGAQKNIIDVGLQAGPWKFKYGPSYGLAEYYKINGKSGAITVQISRAVEASSSRIGRGYAHYVPSYRTVEGKKGIIDLLSESSEPRMLVKAFREMCAEMRVKDFKDRGLLQIFFHVLVNEQVQFQSSIYTREPKFKFGIIVSFARLIRMLGDGHISTRDVFEKYKLYSTINVLRNEKQIRETCADIDILYMESYNMRELTEKDAINDLEFLYGSVAPV